MKLPVRSLGLSIRSLEIVFRFGSLLRWELVVESHLDALRSGGLSFPCLHYSSRTKKPV